MTGLSSVLRHLKARSLAVLCYHRVLPSAERADYPLPDLVLTPEAFARHVDFCCRHYNCLPLREAVEVLKSGVNIRKPLLTFTFDDGYWDNFKYARPILNQHGVRPTIFVITSLIGRNRSPWYDRLARVLMRLPDAPAREHEVKPSSDAGWEWLDQRCGGGGRGSIRNLLAEAKALDPDTRKLVLQRITSVAQHYGWDIDTPDRIMSREELERLVADGYEIASHTRTHPILTQLTAEGCRRELESSRAELQDIISGPVVSLSYPNGDYNEDVAACANRAGYRYAVTTRSGVNGREVDPFSLRRLFVSQDRTSRVNGSCSTSLLELELTGFADTVFCRNLRHAFR